MKWSISGMFGKEKIPKPPEKFHYKRPHEKIMSLNESIYLLRINQDDGKNKRSCFATWVSAQSRIYDLKITIGEQDRLRILEFVKATPVEVYLEMLVERTENHFHLYKPLYFKQIGSETKTDRDQKDEDRYLRELMESERPFEEIEKEIINMRCWIHSHAFEGASCSWSKEDNVNVERNNNQDFFISIVVRTDHVTDDLFYNCRLDLFPPNEEICAILKKFNVYYPGRLTFTGLPVEVIDDRGPDFNLEKIKEEAAKMAKEKVETIADRFPDIFSEKNDDDDKYWEDIWQYQKKK